MWKSKYANASDEIKRKRNAEKINMDKYQFYLSARIQCLSLLDKTSHRVHPLGASFD